MCDAAKCLRLTKKHLNNFYMTRLIHKRSFPQAFVLYKMLMMMEEVHFPFRSKANIK